MSDRKRHALWGGVVGLALASSGCGGPAPTGLTPEAEAAAEKEHIRQRQEAAAVEREEAAGGNQK